LKFIFSNFYSNLNFIHFESSPLSIADHLFNEEEFSIKGKFIFMTIRTRYSTPGGADDIDTLLNGVIINKKLKIIM
jgi:hypothetical protein